MPGVYFQSGLIFTTKNLRFVVGDARLLIYLARSERHRTWIHIFGTLIGLILL